MSRFSSVVAVSDLPSPQPVTPMVRQRASWPWYVRLVSALSMPLMALVLLLACLWMWIVPRKRARLGTLRSRVPGACPWYVAVWVFAGTVLDRWPFLVLLMLAAGACVGTIIGGPSQIPLGLVSAVFGASLAPVIADDLPAWLFPRR